jgi:DNA polymerase III epsilon subunit family exonuclease
LKDYCVIDVETTGLESEHEIVELGALRIRNNEVVAEFSQLVKPIKMPTPEVIDIHHITPEMLKDQPRFGEVYEKYRKFIGDDVVVGFVVDFDLGMLYREAKHCKAKPINNQSFDVKRISGKGGLSHHATQYNLGVQRHRALGDCELA